jgi:hypothetical protein
MVAIDTSTFVAYFGNSPGPDVEFLDRLLEDRAAVIVPAVLSELLSEPTLARTTEQALLALPVLAVLDGYWQRVGRLRRSMLRAGRKTRLADTLIAQSCIDHRTMLLTRDADFGAYAQYSDLILWRAGN